VIYSKLEDYESSSLYYNAAIKNEYPDKTDLERRLAYNYYLLSDTENMIKTFGYLIDEKDANENDYYLAIYSAIINKKTEKAIFWSKKGLKRFPKEETFYGYLGWVYRELGDLEMSEKFLKL
jgi:tetratricopeptide (TPR) repeat protein